MTQDERRKLLAAAIAARGMSQRRYAERVLFRDAVLVARWAKGELNIPDAVLPRLRTDASRAERGERGTPWPV